MKEPKFCNKCGRELHRHTRDWGYRPDEDVYDAYSGRLVHKARPTTLLVLTCPAFESGVSDTYWDNGHTHVEIRQFLDLNDLKRAEGASPDGEGGVHEGG